MVKKKKQPEILRIPGPKQLQQFLMQNASLFNFSEMERRCGFAKDSLRYICRGREFTPQQYRTVREKILPKLCEFVLLLQNYEA